MGLANEEHTSLMPPIRHQDMPLRQQLLHLKVAHAALPKMLQVHVVPLEANNFGRPFYKPPRVYSVYVV
jgi:hypothetical protein